MRQDPAYSDAELYAQLRETEAESQRAFKTLYDRHAHGVYRYCLRVIGDPAGAEDVFQETFLRLHQSARQKRVMSNFEAFLFRIARNLCLNALQSKHRRTEALPEEPVAVSDSPYEQRELLDLLHRALDHLPPDYREAFMLREYQGMSYRDIADVIGASVHTVRIRLFRARRKLDALLAPYIEDIPEH